MKPSPCNNICTLDQDIDGADRCISCLRTPIELKWNDLSEERKEDIIEREKEEFFPHLDYPQSDEND